MVESLHLSPKLGVTRGGDFAKRSLTGQPPDYLYNWWRKVVTEFCQRKLTFPMDRLPAVSGMAHVVQRLPV